MTAAYLTERRHRLAALREQLTETERAVDQYEQREIRGCRRGQALHVERRVRELELAHCVPLRREIAQLERQIARMERGA